MMWSEVPFPDFPAGGADPAAPRIEFANTYAESLAAHG
jgi:hypothetical protein